MCEKFGSAKCRRVRCGVGGGREKELRRLRGDVLDHSYGNGIDQMHRAAACRRLPPACDRASTLWRRIRRSRLRFLRFESVRRYYARDFAFIAIQLEVNIDLSIIPTTHVIR